MPENHGIQKFHLIFFPSNMLGIPKYKSHSQSLQNHMNCLNVTWAETLKPDMALPISVPH